jgi:AP-3 complex subunit delta-1
MDGSNVPVIIELTGQKQRKAERLAQLRDDPYYIMDDRPSKAVENVDSIPVVHLEDMPPIIGRGCAVQQSSCLPN